jgi:chromate transporter
MLREEVVTRRRWVSEQHFLDALGAVNLVPGPNSTELVMHVGMERAGWRGLLAGGLGFILPATLLTLGFAVLYVEFGSRPQVQSLLYGIKPVIIAVVVQAIWGLSRTAFKTWRLALVAALVLGFYLTGVNELILLFGGAFLAATLERGVGQVRVFGFMPIWMVSVLQTTVPTSVQASLGGLFLNFLKIGSVLYGSGYVLLAFLRGEFVTRGWITEAQLLDAVAVGQFTPGPVFSSATFVGYVIAGVPGAVLATVGIFAPAFVFVGLMGRLIAWLRGRPWTSSLLDGVNASALGLLVAVTLELGRAALVDVPTVLLSLVALVALIRFRINSAWLVLAGAVLGWLSILVR